jgi:hypothetical protein
VPARVLPYGAERQRCHVERDAVEGDGRSLAVSATQRPGKHGGGERKERHGHQQQGVQEQYDPVGRTDVVEHDVVVSPHLSDEQERDAVGERRRTASLLLAWARTHLMIEPILRACSCRLVPPRDAQWVQSGYTLTALLEGSTSLAFSAAALVDVTLVAGRPRLQVKSTPRQEHGFARHQPFSADNGGAHDAVCYQAKPLEGGTMKITLGKGLPPGHPALRGWIISSPVSPTPTTTTDKTKRSRPRRKEV